MDTTATLVAESLAQNEPAREVNIIRIRRVPFWKRALDVVLSTSLIILLSPLLCAIAIYIKLVSRGPIFFCQKRVGYGTQPFTIFKFRTMKVSEVDRHAEYISSIARSDQPIGKPCHRQRLILGGGLLRKFSLDELPQLFNVLLGDMSLVGPRPDVLPLEGFEPWQIRRFEVLPGITGLWQVSGKNNLTFRRMVELDIQYVDSLSPVLDAKIMIKTVGLILMQDNE